MPAQIYFLQGRPSTDMLRWLADIASVRVTSEKNDDGREEIEDNDDNMMTELILAEVEAIVVAFENEQVSLFLNSEHFFITLEFTSESVTISKHRRKVSTFV